MFTHLPILLLSVPFLVAAPTVALPPPEEVPEEVLRTEIITEARSPINGEPLTAAEYAQLQARLAERPIAPKLDPRIREAIFLLRIRELLQIIF